MTHTINRRKALTVVAAAPAAVAIGAPAVAQFGGGDDELLRLGAELQRLWDLEQPLWDACEQAADDEDWKCAEDYRKRADKYQRQSWAAAHRIAALSATTIAGLKVKALAHRYMTCAEGEEGLEQPDQELAAGMCEDIDAMAGELQS